MTHSLFLSYSRYLTFAPTEGRVGLIGAYRSVSPHLLVFRFNRHRLAISLLDPSFRRNHFSITPGLLLKYLDNRKKGAKRSLPLKLLLVRFLRKLLLVSRVTHLVLVLRGVPLHSSQLFNFLNRPLPHVITDPLTRRPIDETGDLFTSLRFDSVSFVKSKPYGFQKSRKRGRVKRKIRRKIISSARVIDEL